MGGLQPGMLLGNIGGLELLLGQWYTNTGTVVHCEQCL